MNNLSYWTGRNLSRRAALRGGVKIAGLAGLALVGCGGDEEAPAATAAPQGTAAPGAASTATPTATEAAGVLGSLDDTSAQAVPGGIYNLSTVADVEGLDPLSAGTFPTMSITRYAYPTLVNFAPGIGGAASGDVEPALAESWEFPDPTTLVLNLRPDAKWDPRAPTDSRAVDAEDVAFSWEKFAATGVQRATLVNAVSAQAPITGIEALDDHTIQVNSAFQYGPLLGGLAYTYLMQIMPVEAGGAFDPRNEVRGAGPWMLEQYQQSVKFTMRKNPNYWDKQLPYLDGIDIPIIPEYAQRLAQFRAGRLYSGVVTQQDVLSTKQEIPELDVYRGDFSGQNATISFGLRPDSPFRDERVRRAVSMLIDRDLIIDSFNNREQYEAAGWPFEARLCSLAVAPGYEAFWLDPKGVVNDGFTPEQRALFEYNPGEATKLMEAAGHGGGIETEMRWIDGRFGSEFERVGAAYKGMLEGSGLFKLKEVHPDYTTEWADIFYGLGDWEGILWTVSAVYPHVGLQLNNFYHSQGVGSKTAFQKDPSSVEGTAASDALIEEALAAIDFDEQVELVKRWQRENIERMPAVSVTGTYGVPPFQLSWPWAMNVGVYRDYLGSASPMATTYPHWWIDEAKQKELTR